METEERFITMMMDALDGQLSPGERAELDDHLRDCPHCLQEWQVLLAIETLFRQTPILMPAVNFAERTLARLPNSRTRRYALGGLYILLLMSGILPLLIGLSLAVRFAPVLSQPGLLSGYWDSVVSVGRVLATVIESFFIGAGHFILAQPALIGWFIILAGLVFLWGGVFQWLLVQPLGAFSRNES